MNPPSNFQSMIMALQHFWGERGCLIWQPYFSQVGAGTMNPATFLRVLGPEPWNVAYVEPSVRPDDGRYGDNPYRFQQHTQFQVILKPDPGNPQEIYLNSLQAIGIDPARHDIRFVEDNWESPALGAWGLGWEVWLDGQEITQFTYFQQAGGQVLEPVSVEITYGLERIAMTLQRVRHYKDLGWNESIKFGDLTYLPEFEYSKYYFEIADVDRLRQMYDLYQAECEKALEQGLVLPAYDYVLKCSHTFNVLDTRGAVGVTERQALFGRMRDLSRRVSEVYLEQRRQLEYPWLKDSAPSAVPVASRDSIAASVPQVAAPADFLLEIGTEELPSADLDAALAQLTQRTPALLQSLHLAHGEVRVLGTPRRLVVHVKELAPRQPDRETLVKGPPASKAFTAAGEPTPAAIGFAKSKGLNVEQLEVREIDGGQYAAALVQEQGLPAAQALAEALPGLIGGIKFEKSMRWNTTKVAFSRPIRWLLALFGGGVVPFEYAGLRSGDITRGLRFRQPETARIQDVQAYFDYLAGEGIRLDPAERRAEIAAQTAKLMQQAGGAERVDDAILDEVNNLVEAPTALLGRFDPARLKLPLEVLVSVMKKYQRYFPVYKADGSLLPCFIAVRNGDAQHLEVVADGNEQVIGARFDDANFFIQQDLRQPLQDYLPRLGTLMFQKKLGSMLDKTHRVEELAQKLAEVLALAPDEAATARRAAALCKADLVTSMVVEMTALQGVMGRYYALHVGESEAVARAIYEHYLPRFTGDEVPTEKPGLVVGLADRLDTLAGLFSVGLAPSGTKDPFAQRRAALGLVQALTAWQLDFDLRQGLALAAELLPVPAEQAALTACFDFIAGRMRNQFVDAGWRYDVVDAVLAEQAHNPAAAERAVKALSEWVARPDWHQVLPAFSRCVRITRDQDRTFSIDPDAFGEAEEVGLYHALRQAETVARKPGDMAGFLEAFQPIIPAINNFFDKVLVMAEDEKLRANRLGLLQRIAALANGVADFSRLEGF